MRRNGLPADGSRCATISVQAGRSSSAKLAQHYCGSRLYRRSAACQGEQVCWPLSTHICTIIETNYFEASALSAIYSCHCMEAMPTRRSCHRSVPHVEFILHEHRHHARCLNG